MNLPERYGKSDSVCKAFRRWCQKGLWKSWFEKVASKQPKGVAITMIDATHIKVHQDATRQSLAPDTECLGIHAEAIVLGDKGYDSDELRNFIFAMDGVPMIPPKSNRKTKVFYDKEIGKQRKMVENFFLESKDFAELELATINLVVHLWALFSLLPSVIGAEIDFVRVA